MNGDTHRDGLGIDAEARVYLESLILARLILIDDTSRFPDVAEIREVAREILAEQLRELREDTAGLPPIPSLPRRPIAG